MATYSTRTDRIRNSAAEIDAVIRAATEGLTPDEVKARRTAIFGKVATPAEVGDTVFASDLFAGTPFYGVRGEVTSDPALQGSGAHHLGVRVMVRFSRPIIGRRMFFGFPLAGLAKVTDEAEAEAATEASA